MQGYKVTFWFGLFLVLVGSLFQGACATFLNGYHISDYHSKALSTSSPKKVVASERTQLVFMGLRFNSKYVDEAFSDLERKCPNQRISGIHTRYTTKSMILFWTHKIFIRGYCHSS